MAYNFPDAPTLNQVFQSYTWDGEKWYSTIGGIAKPSPVTVDPYWYNVKLLMGFTGANGAANGTGFVDESPTARGNATVAGNAQISTAQSKFGGSALLLDGTGDFLTYGDSPDWQFDGQFTIECWVYYNTVADAAYISQWDMGVGVACWMFGHTAAAGLYFTFYDTVSVIHSLESAWTPSAGVWYHVAVDRDVSGVMRTYVDGVMRGKNAFGQTFLNSIKALSIGRIDHTTTRYMNGYIEEVRITKGAARYASDSGYTVPVAAFPRAGGALVTPPSLTGLIGWWDASVTASLSLTGSDINSMADQSAAGQNMTWVTWRPVYSATGVNGRPAFVLGGIPLYNAFANTSFAMGTGNTLTLWWVGQISSAASDPDNAGLISYKAAGQSTDYGNAGSFIVCRDTTSTTNIKMYRVTSQAVACSNDVNHRVIVTVNPSGVQTFYVDGVSIPGATQSGNWISPGVLSIGRSGTARHIAASIGEVGIATGWHDATAVAQLDLYLATKWGLDPASQFLARTTGLDATHVNAYTALINGLMVDGVWDKLDVLYIYATQNSTTANLNLVSTNYPATINGSPTFTADRGYTGIDGSTTTYINPGFNAATAASPKHVQNSAHLSVWNVTNQWAVAPGIGTSITASGNSNFCWPRDSASGWSYLRINVNTGIDNLSMPNASGHFVANRSGSNARQGYRNGALAVSGGQASIAVTNAPMYALGANVDGAPKGAGQQHAMASIGSSLDGAQALAFYNRLRTYMSAVGITDYGNPGGTGDRTTAITITTNIPAGGGAISMMVNGTQNLEYWFTNGFTSAYIKFDFGTPRLINEFTWYQGASSTHGTWVLGGSNDDSTYTEFPESLALGTAGTVAYPVTNTARYRYYRLRQTSGTTSSGPYIREIEFKIA